MATPANSSSRETHWTLDRDFLNINTLNRAVVRIFSWYVTCRCRQVSQVPGRCYSCGQLTLGLTWKVAAGRLEMATYCRLFCRV